MLALMLDEAKGKMTNGSIMELLQVVSQPSTIWSVVYRMSSKTLDVAVGRDYGSVKSFSISTETENISHVRNN